MTYQEATDYLYNQMPMFEKQGASGYKEGLENSLELDRHFGHPHRQFRSIHVGGTNGKGSVSHSLAAMLQACGYKVGLYTSPHLVDFRERIRINGHQIPEDYVIKFIERERAYIDTLHPSFFEVTTAMAFKYFAEQGVEIAVIEVGLGGRLDCTNIISPILSIITNISYDHTQFLGDSLQKIATEKAGIIKEETPVVIGEALPGTRPVFESVARQKKAPIVFAEDHPEVILAAPSPKGGFLYKTAHGMEFRSELQGIYQKKNTNTILCALGELTKLGFLCSASNPSCRNSCNIELNYAFENICQLTGLMGRWQVVRQSPMVVCDTGHNVGGWIYLSKQLATVKCRQMHIVFGMVEDKDVNGILDLLPKNATYYFTKSRNKRSLSERSLASKGIVNGLNGNYYPTVKEAWEAALQAADKEDFIFVGGSSYVVGEFLELQDIIDY